MRLIFLGTGGFAVPALRLLCHSEHDIACVITTAPKPSGRGRRLLSSPVAAVATEMGIRVMDPADPHAPDMMSVLSSMRPDVGVLAAYGVILKSNLLRLPKLGIVNIHPSLLPLYRGAAPVQRQLMNGETRSGVTIIALSEQVDAGDILAQTEVEVGPDETCGELLNRLAVAGANLLLSVLDSLEQGSVKRHPQDPDAATSAPKVAPSERKIDWTRTSREIHNHIRALSPEPGAVTFFRGRRLLLLRSRVITFPTGSPPATIENAKGSLVVACGDGAVELLELKPEGRRIQTAREFCNGYHPRPGETISV